MPAPARHRPASFVAQFLRDAARALRPVWRRPAFAFTAILSLAVGIGAITTVLSVVDALLVQPLPYPDPGRLVAIWPTQTFAGREIAEIRARSKLYDQVAGFSPGWLMTLTDITSPRQLSAARVSGSFFQLLGVPPLVGHTFGMESEVAGNDKVAVLSYEFWQSALDADPKIVGRSISLSGTTYTVAAVMPKGFSTLRAGTDMWTPLTMDPSEMTWTGATAAIYGKLARGATTPAATAEIRVLAEQMRAEFDHPPSWSGGARVTALQESIVGGVRTILLVLLAAVAFLLLIAVANVSNLFLVRTAERRQEMAIRTSLGATARQIATLLLGESAALGAIGGACGIGLAYLGVGLLRRILPAGMPRLDEIAVDARVLAVALVITVLSAVVAGVAPSLQGLGTRLATRIRAGRTIAGGGNGTRGALVAVEVALALVLTIGAAVMGRTLVSLHDVDRGLRTDHLLTMRLQPSAASSDGYRNYWRAVLGQLRGIPGVTGAATILHLPTSGRNWQADIEIEGRPIAAGETPPRAGWQSVSNGYFATAGMAVLKGRAFDATDGAGAPRVLALNSVLADALFPGENPVGKRIRAGNATAKDWATIVAVVSSVRHDSLSAPPAPELYAPFDQLVVVANSLVIRTAGDPLALAPVIRDRIHTVDRSVPISEVRTMDDLYSRSLQRQRMILTLFGLFAGAGLLLSAVGIYGVVAYGVRQRMNEIGIRVALGADALSIKRLIVGQGLRYALAGIAVGVPVAIALSGFMRGMVFGVVPVDPLSFALVPLFLLLVATAASWIPARRAAAADPCEVLRR